MKSYDFIITGAGSIGLPLSFYLASKGAKVAVIESHASPGQGQNKSAIGGIRATHSDPAKIRISQYSIEIVSKMKELYGMDVAWKQGGYLFPVYDLERERALKSLLEVQHKFGLDISWVDNHAVSTLVPGIKTRGLRGGTYSPGDGSAFPLKLAGAFFKLAMDAGVDFYFYEKLLSMKTEGDKITQIRTTKDIYSAGLFINAAGGNAREVGGLCGEDVQVFPDSHEAGITEPVENFFDPMVVDIRSETHSENYYFYQNREGQIVFCITPRPKMPGKDRDSTSDFLPLVTRRMLELYSRLRNIRVRRVWRGLYPMSPDGFPIVGYGEKISNYFTVGGMSGQGFMLGPGLGRILSEIFIDRTDKYDFILKQFSPDRDFSGDEILK
ncbi:MAG: FAD-binding oxidoreductase [bacterium]